MSRACERRCAALALALLVVGATVTVRGQSAGSGDPEAEARAVVQDTSDRVTAILTDESLSQEEKKERVRALAEEQFDFYVISRLVLARNWKKFSDAQKAEFQEVFKDHLAATYGDALDNYEGETSEIVGSRLEKRGDVTVRTVVQSKGENIKVDYRLRKRDEGWRGIDIIVEGVSLVQNFRSQAQEIVNSEGPEGIIKRLREKSFKRDA